MERPWIVVPCFNEDGRLDRSAFETFLARSGGPFVVFVDDGSTDGTRGLLEAIVDAHPDRARVLALPANRGKGEAVRRGMRVALAEGAGVVGYWDADLATPLAQIGTLASVLETGADIDVVMGARVRLLGRRIERSALRHYVGRVYATVASNVLRLPVYDTQCGAKLFRSTPALARALAEPFRTGWSFDVELLRRLQIAWDDRGEDRIVEVPLEVWEDVGESKVSLLAGAAAFAALFRLWMRPGGR